MQNEARSNGAVTSPQADHVAEMLRRAIVEGELAPGNWIRQEAIARKFGTSRIPAREALRRLEAEGLVTIVPHTGARVAILDRSEFVEIYRIRESLEPLAVAESAKRLNAEQLATIRSRLYAVEEVAGSAEEWLERDRAFHIATYSMAPTRMQSAIETFWNTTQQYRRVLLRTFSRSHFELIHAEHRLLMDALERHDADYAATLLRLHIRRTRTRLENDSSLLSPGTTRTKEDVKQR
jgi:DNA-binding GntR family transcriptional regulator